MLFKKLEDITPFIAGDATLLREWLHPKNDEVELPYSLAFAEVAPGAASLPHTLQTSTEVYIVLEEKASRISATRYNASTQAN